MGMNIINTKIQDGDVIFIIKQAIENNRELPQL